MNSGAADRSSPSIARREKSGSRTVKAIYDLSGAVPDPQFEVDLATELRGRLSSDQLLGTFTQYAVRAISICL